MAEQQSQQQQLSMNIEREVRTLIGDLQMQVIVLRQMLDMAQGPQAATTQAQPGKPPLRPVPPSDDNLPRRPNGGAAP